MKAEKLLLFVLLVITSRVSAQTPDPYQPDSGRPKEITGMTGMERRI